MLDECPRGAVARRGAGAPPGEVDDVGTAGDEAVDAGLDVRIEVRRRLEQLPSPAPDQGRPVDQVTDDRGRRCRKRGVVEVHLVPVQPAHRRVRAGVERLVEERGVQRQRRHDVDVEPVQRRRQVGQVGERGQRCAALPERVRRHEQPGAAGQLGGTRHRRRGDHERRRLDLAGPLDAQLVAADGEVRRHVDPAVARHQFELGAVGERQLDRRRADLDAHAGAPTMTGGRRPPRLAAASASSTSTTARSVCSGVSWW